MLRYALLSLRRTHLLLEFTHENSNQLLTCRIILHILSQARFPLWVLEAYITLLFLKDQVREYRLYKWLQRHVSHFNSMHVLLLRLQTIFYNMYHLRYLLRSRNSPACFPANDFLFYIRLQSLISMMGRRHLSDCRKHLFSHFYIYITSEVLCE